MTKFKADLILGILVWLVGRAVLDQHIGTEISDSVFRASLQWLELLFGYVAMILGACLIWAAVISKLFKGKVK